MASQRREGIFITDKNFIDFLFVIRDSNVQKTISLKKQLLCETRKPYIKLEPTLTATDPTRQTRQHSNQTLRFLGHNLAELSLVREEAH